MTANQRRPGFRLPWSSETDGSADEADPNASAAESAPADETATATQAEEPSAQATGEPATEAPEAPASDDTAREAVTATGETTSAGEPDSAPQAAASDTRSTASEPATPRAGEAGTDTAATAEPAQDEAPAAATAEPVTGDDFLRDLVAAMRRVADETRQAGVEELRARAEEQVRKLEADAEKRREELRTRTETDVAAIGDWARAEAERIKAEAEQRVVARRSQLDQQLAGDAARTETETKAVRDRVAEYERELEAYHAQLAEINDPAAFAAAAKRMPRPPQLVAAALTARADAAATPTAPAASGARTPVEPATRASNGAGTTAANVHPAEEEVLAARLAQLDATLPSGDAAVATATSTEPVTTEVVVKGLGSFGAITGFRQSLSAVDGIQGVALSLGQTGEFVFRATHAPGFDLRAAITALEGDSAKIEDRPEGGLRVTLERAR